MLNLDRSLFAFYSSNSLDPLFLVPEVVRDKNHPQHYATMVILDSIPEVEVEKILNDSKFRFLLTTNGSEAMEQAARVSYLTRFLQKEIPRMKYQLLVDQRNSARPEPYEHKALSDLSLDKNNLVSTKDFVVVPGALERKKFCFTLLPTGASNSSYWLYHIIRSSPTLQNSIRVRLDPWVWGPLEEFRHIRYKMWVWGKPLDWDSLLKLRESFHGRWMTDAHSSQGILFTDFVWQPSDAELAFTCEEIPTSESICHRGARYFHAIYSKMSGDIKHCDGAIRLLTANDHKFRARYHVKDPEVRKIGTRIKVFQVDDEISTELFCGLASAFYVWNQDVTDYFAL